MNILQINAVCGGSTGRNAVEMARVLSAQGHHCVLAYAAGAAAPDVECLRIGSDWDHKLHAFLSRLTGKQACFSRGATDRLLQYMGEFRPDIVHLHNLHANYIHLPRLLAYLSEHDIATVVTLHDCWVFTGKCTHYQQSGCRKWQTGCQHCPSLKQDNVSWLFDRTSRLYRDKKEGFSGIPRLGVVGVSDWITEEGRRSFLATAKKLCRIYNWVNLQTFSPAVPSARAKYGIADTAYVVLCISAGWKDDEKWHDVCDISKRLQKDEQLVIVGSLSPGLKPPAGALHIPYVEQVAALASIYAMADAYVHLSRQDTFGKVIAEALSCGTPVVVYDNTACPELVPPGAGFRVPAGDTAAVVDCLHLLRKSGKSSLSAICRGFAREHFSMNANIDAYADLYKELCR